MKGRERMGSSLPPTKLATQDSSLFLENEVHIFYCAGGKIGEVARVFHRTLAQRHRTLCLAQLGLGTGRRLEPVGASGVLSPVFCVFAMLSGYETGEHRTVWCSASGDPVSLQTSLSLSLVSTGRVRWQLNRVRCSAGDR